MKQSQQISNKSTVIARALPEATSSLKQIPQLKAFSTYNYVPLLNLKHSDFISLKTNYEVYIPFGEDNLLPSQLNQLAREVPVHRAILNSKASYIIGRGFSTDNKIIQQLIDTPNNTFENLNSIFRYVVHDYLNIGNAYIEIITNPKKSFTYLYHIDSSKCRLSALENDVLIHPSWAEFKGKNDENLTSLPLFPQFRKGPDGLLHSVYHIKDYEPEFYYYGLCSYFAGLRSIIISGLTNLWNQNRLEVGFTAPGLLIIPGINDEADANSLDEEFSKFKGVDGEKSGDIIIQYLADLSPGQTSQQAKFIEFKKNNDGNWMDLHTQSELSIITIHNWFRSLTPYSGEKTGFDSNRIVNEYEIALNTIINPLQSFFLRHIDQILQYFSLPLGQLNFINEPPIQRINPLKFVWEARRDAGLDYDASDPIQKMLIMQLKNTFNSSTPDTNTIA